VAYFVRAHARVDNHGLTKIYHKTTCVDNHDLTKICHKTESILSTISRLNVAMFEHYIYIFFLRGTLHIFYINES